MASSSKARGQSWDPWLLAFHLSYCGMFKPTFALATDRTSTLPAPVWALTTVGHSWAGSGPYGGLPVWEAQTLNLCALPKALALLCYLP